MSNTLENVTSYGIRGVSVKVSMYNPIKVMYNPLSHNPPAPIRPGADDAFKCNSIDHAGISRPYWANQEGL